MAANTPLSAAERERIAQLHAEGASCNAIAKDLGRSPSTISKAAKAAGLSFDADRTAPATENRMASNRAKRALLETRLLDEAGLLLDALHKPHTVFSFGGRDNTYAEETLPEPDVAAKATLVRAAGTAVDKALKLADADRAGTGAEAGKSMVGALFAALAVTPVEGEQAEHDGAEQ